MPRNVSTSFLTSEGIFRECKLCGEAKALEDFLPNKGFLYNRHYYCKHCYRTKLIWRHLRPKFNISKEQYLAMFRKQRGVCAICFQPERSKRKPNHFGINKLAVDHNHKTGKIRGLLCNCCNTALGRFNDSVAVLQNAISYLEGY